MRAHTGPPRVWERKKNAGWKKASPDSASNMKLSAMVQWLTRSEAG